MKTASTPDLAFVLETPIFYGGGVSVLVRELIEQLGSRFAIVLVSPDAAEEIEGSPLRPFLHSHVHWAPGRMSRHRAREMAEVIRATGVRLAHFHMGGNLAWGNRTPWTSPFPPLRRAGVRCLTTSHLVVSFAQGLFAPGDPWWKRTVKLAVSWLGKLRALAAQECEVAVSQHDLRLLQRWYFPLRSRFQCIYHSRLPSDVAAKPVARVPLILHVGHRARRKGQLVLVEAFIRVAARHPEWELTLVGPVAEPEYEERLVAAVQAAGLEKRIHLLGQQDASELMDAAAVYVQPSLEEALGLALQEALFAGCACIGTRVGGIPELIEDERTGLLAPADDAAALAEALERLMRDGSLRERLATAGAASIRERGMTAESMAAQYTALYDRIRQPQTGGRLSRNSSR